MRKISAFGVALAMVVTSTATLAQDFLPGTSPMDSVARMNVITNGAINSAVSRNAFRYRSGNNRGPAMKNDAAAGLDGLVTQSTATDPGAARRVGFPYRSTTASQTEAKAEFLQRLRRNDPGAAAAISPEIARNDIDRIYRGITGPFGLSPNDAGDVMTAYVVLGWMIANGANDPSLAGVRAARRSIGSLLAQSGSISDTATRTKLAEELKISFVVLHAGWQSALKEGNVRQYADGTAKLFRTATGDDLRRITLTDRGFKRRS